MYLSESVRPSLNSIAIDYVQNNVYLRVIQQLNGFPTCPVL